MARPLSEFESSIDAPAAAASRRRVDRSTARALAAAVASLAVATIVVTQSAQALHPEGTAAENSFESGTVALVDDDDGRSLVNLENMAPGRPVVQCITITYTGTILPVEVTLAAAAEGDVADYLLVDVERGVSGGFDSCAGFRRVASIYSGLMSGLTSEGPRAAGVLSNDGEEVTFRFTFDLVDEIEAAGRAGSVDFVWEAVPR